ncbi:MAG: hypothetical protein DWQ35_01685 [Planctomycetota bacterium]|nr:MAG: hypothetical protein DWQ35_01685 [Planctomycetota bacterium]
MIIAPLRRTNFRLLIGSGLLPLCLALTLLASLLLPAGQLRAAEPAAASLKLVPEDASAYTAFLRLREQFDLVANSNWWAKISESDKYKGAMMMWEMMASNPGSPAGELQEALKNPDNAKLYELLKGMVSDEVFMYTGANAAEAFELMQRINNANNAASLEATAEFQRQLENADDFGNLDYPDPGINMMRAVLQTLAEDTDRVAVPEMLLGFKTDDTDEAERQLRRLEAYVTVILENEPDAAMLRGRVDRQEIGEGEFLVLTLDGAMIPWDQAPWDRLSDKPSEFDEVVDKITASELVIAIGVHKGYVMLSVGPSLAHVEKLGSGTSLADSPRLAPVAAMGEKRFTLVSYSDAAMNAALGWSEGDLDAFADMAKSFLMMSELDDDAQQAVLAEIPEIKKDLASMMPDMGDRLTVGFLNGRGYEMMSYDWGTNKLLDGSQPLSLLNHLGGKPILAFAGRGVHRPQDYEMVVKWLTRTSKFFEKHVVPTMDDDDQEAYAQVVEVAYPALRQADKVTREMLIPSMADGQFAFVIDAEATSPLWHVAIPDFGRDMPMAMPALVTGLSDSEQFAKALGEYKRLFVETYEKLRELEPEEFPPLDVPEAQQETHEAVDFYSYALPMELGVDEKVTVTLGIHEKFALMGLLPEQLKRLAKPTPLVADSVPLKDLSRPLAAATYFDLHALSDAVRPWVEETVIMQMQMGGDLGDFGDFDDEFNEALDVTEQIEFWFSVVRVVHGFSSATYMEDGATVTHAELHLEDIEP